MSALKIEQRHRDAAAQTVFDDGSHTARMLIEGILSGAHDASPAVPAVQAIAQFELDHLAAHPDRESVAREEILSEALFALSARLLKSGFLNDDENHAAYERVVAAFNASAALKPVATTPTAAGGSWSCAARRSKLPEPQDCDWPMCQCDPYASKVIEALEESGVINPKTAAADGNETCERCQGNGEIVTDWERYMHPQDGDKGDEAVATCPDCDGDGHTTAGGDLEAKARELVREALEAELGDSYDCTRVWQAWSVGTMSEDDFEPVINRLDEIASSVCAALTAALSAGRENVREECAQIIEQNQETTTNTSDGTRHHLTPRRPGNIAGLAYAAAIRQGGE